MKSKYIATYGKKTDYCSFNRYHIFDNIRYKSTIAAPARTTIEI